MIIHNGFACDGEDFIKERYTRQYFRQIKDWGFNALLVALWWGDIEQNADEVGVYNESNLECLRYSIDLAKSEGLEVIISGRVCYDPVEMPSWAGWATHDYVNMSDEGLKRYAQFWEMVVRYFPDCMYCLWHYPYHRQAVDEARRDRFYNITFPTLLDAVRKNSNNWVVFSPIHQGAIPENDENANYYLTAKPLSDNKIIYGLPHMIPWSVSYYEEWDYDIKRMDDAFAGIVRWRETLDLPMMSVEYAPLYWNVGVPIRKSRLDCLEESLKRMSQYRVGWMYWWMSLWQKNETNILIAPEKFKPHPQIFNLLQKYLTPTPPPLFPKLRERLYPRFPNLYDLVDQIRLRVRIRTRVWKVSRARNKL